MRAFWAAQMVVRSKRRIAQQPMMLLPRALKHPVLTLRPFRQWSRSRTSQRQLFRRPSRRDEWALSRAPSQRRAGGGAQDKNIKLQNVSAWSTFASTTTKAEPVMSDNLSADAPGGEAVWMDGWSAARSERDLRQQRERERREQQEKQNEARVRAEEQVRAVCAVCLNRRR